MNEYRSSFRRIDFAPNGGRQNVSTTHSGGNFLDVLAAGLLALALVGCTGQTGSGDASSAGGSAAAPVIAPGTGTLAASTALSMTITAVTINSPPVVNFTVTNQDGIGMTGLVDTDLRFNIAKLMRSSDGGPSSWQNYINRPNAGAVQGAQEIKTATAGYVFGTLVNRGNGVYTYTFATDIKNGICPVPCTDANGKALDIGYDPGVTHRVTIEQANPLYPKSAGVLDFVPNSGLGAKREIVASATCAQCHTQFVAHTSGVEVRLCVTCHNPGTWVAGIPNVAVDFKAMIHKIHYNKDGAALPSVLAGTPYVVAGKDFSKVAFPQDVRSCTKCHDGTAGSAIATTQGDNWKIQPSIEACGSCHDDVYFSTKADVAKPYQTKAHSGGVMTDSSSCALCHAAGKFTDNKDVALAHNFPARAAQAAAKFQYNIISVTPTTAGATPVITFSVTDPTNANKPYDIKADKPFLGFAAGGPSTLTVKLGWSTSDFGNDSSGENYGQPVSVNLLNNATVTAGATAGTYTVTSTVAVPAAQKGTLRALMEGHPAGDVTIAGKFTDRLPVTSVFKDFAITDATATARRVVVDVAKCNVCHGVLSAHGNNRNNEPGVCAVCHNPNATDRTQRIAAGAAGEEAIDFKTMIHGIHAGKAPNGFRQVGITIYGFGARANDFSSVVFPGRLSNCTTCHTPTSYLLTGIWATPTASKILGTTTNTGASATLTADNLRTSPTAAVCSSCHDGAATKIHMQDAFNGGLFSVTQAAISAAAEENCSFCHGSGRVFDVKTVHRVQ